MKHNVLPVVLRLLLLLTPFVVIFPSANVHAATPASKKTAKKYPVKYKVQKEDTIGKIALKFEADVFDLKEWNNLDSWEIEPGREIIVEKEKKEIPVRKGPTYINIYHKIRPGDTLSKIAKKYRVKLKDVRRWNRNVNPRRLQLGRSLRIVQPSRVKTSSSWGATNDGRLYNPAQLKSSDVIRARTPSLSYGTERTIDLIEAGAADVKEAYPNTASLLVGDISRQSGGRLRPHRSHQSGRDADITYYHKGNVELDRFREMNEETFDVAKTWRLFKSWIDAKKVVYIFVDYRLQKVLYEYLRYEGYSDDELAKILSYPPRPASRRAIIRNARGHLNHFHVRFTCGPLDIHCR